MLAHVFLGSCSNVCLAVNLESRDPVLTHLFSWTFDHIVLSRWGLNILFLCCLPSRAVFLAFLAAVIVYNRLEFTLSRDDKWAAGQAQDHLATLMEQVQAIMEGELHEQETEELFVSASKHFAPFHVKSPQQLPHRAQHCLGLCYD